MELRINAGMGRQVLAWRAKTSAKTIRFAENGHVPGPDIQFRIARVFDLAPTDIWPLSSQRSAERGRA